MFETLQQWTASTPEAFQWLAVMLISTIPFVDSYEASFIGVVVGVFPVLAIAAAVLGNTASMLAFVHFADAIKIRWERKTAKNPKKAAKRKAKNEKLHRNMNRWGVPGGAILGPFLLPPQLTSVAMISFGADRKRVIFWQIIAITLWGVLFGLLGIGVLTIAGGSNGEMAIG